MLKVEELMGGMIQYGRCNIQDAVARSQDIGDTLSYLRVERFLEMVKATSFITTDLVGFVSKTGSLKKDGVTLQKDPTIPGTD